MPDDAKRPPGESTESGLMPKSPSPEVDTGKHRTIDPGATGRYQPVEDEDSDDGPPTSSIRRQHALSSGPPAIPGYDIVGELGRGGMGVVHKAWHTPTKRFVALKMILANGEESEANRRRFRIEAEAATRLSHPNIVQAYEVGEFNGHPFVSLEFCSGANLANKLAGNPMLPQTAAHLLEKLARAVEFAHAQKIIHRDLKPANILLTSEGEPKISDFGLAKRLDSTTTHTRRGIVVGTPSYMPPEQTFGTGPAIGPTADIYALGAILYECLTGRPPFKSATPGDTLDQVKNQPPVPPRLLNATVPTELDTICLKCLRKVPDERYASAGQLADDIRRYLAGQPILAKPESPPDVTMSWLKKQPITALIAAIAAIAVLYFAVKGVIATFG